MCILAVSGFKKTFLHVYPHVAQISLSKNKRGEQQYKIRSMYADSETGEFSLARTDPWTRSLEAKCWL